MVMFIHRDEVYYTEEEWEKRNLGKPYPKGLAEIIIAKHRNGPIGQTSLRFLPKVGRFDDLEVAQI